MGQAAVNLSNDIRLELSKPYYGIRLWKGGCFKGAIFDSKIPGGKGRYVSAGEEGVSDLVGIWGPWGVGVYIEVKAGLDAMRTNQIHFQDMTTDRGGIHVVARDVGACVIAIESSKRKWIKQARYLLGTIREMGI